MNEPRHKVVRPTVRDVAALAGVGTMTVSRVVNESGYVAEKTREKVLDAIRQLGYVPNAHARGLRVKRSQMVALILSDLGNPFFTTVARGVEDVAKRHGYLVLVANTDENGEEEVRAMRALIEKGVDGALLVPARSGAEAMNLARDHHLPVVALDRRGPPSFDSVMCDSEQGAKDLARLLLDHGHRQIAVLAGPEGVTTSEDRVRSFLAAIEAEGASAVVYRGSLTVREGATMALEAMNGAIRPTAMFATNNFLSIGALNALSESGIRVPEDVSITGFDDLPDSIVTFPFLTVAAQPAYELGKAAAERLFQRIAEPDLPPEEQRLATRLVQRKSVAPKQETEAQ